MRPGDQPRREPDRRAGPDRALFDRHTDKAAVSLADLQMAN